MAVQDWLAFFAQHSFAMYPSGHDLVCLHGKMISTYVIQSKHTPTSALLKETFCWAWEYWCQFRIQSVKGWAHTSHFFLNSRQKSMLGCEIFTIREGGSAALGSWKVLTETPSKILVGSGLVRWSMICFSLDRHHRFVSVYSYDSEAEICDAWCWNGAIEHPTFPQRSMML